MRDDLINELSRLCGIVSEYWDIFGNKYITPMDTNEAILRSMRLKIDSEHEISESISTVINKQWLSFIEPVKVLSVNNQPFSLSIFIPLNEGDEGSIILYCRVEDESGRTEEFELSGDSLRISEQKWINNQRYIKIDFSGGHPMEMGFYSLSARCISASGEISGVSRIIITPDSCYVPPELDGNRRLWGITLNLYSIHSLRNWGCGDFSDLGRIMKWLEELNAGFAAINPLHALLNKMPYDISPYSPVSRLYKNLIYLDVESVPEASESKAAQTAMRRKSFKDELKKLRDAELIDYEAIAALKEKILRYAFEIFYERHYKKTTERGSSFDAYLSEEGQHLQSFSLFWAIYSANNSTNWHLWQKEYQNRYDEHVMKFRQENEKEILFYCYIQWLIDSQIRKTVESNKGSMTVGPMFDLAIGSMGGGSDVWNYQDIFALGINVGAPPDDFNPIGQDWGFPPLIPERLRDTGYEFFIQTIRKTMKYAGALRIDHALGMFRLFWIPEGRLPSEGAYIKYPSEDLLRIIALESVRNKTVIIAEDLGTVGENVHDRLREFNMLSYKLLYFERNYPSPSFAPPDSYPRKTLCAVTTHDLATIYGFWASRDIEVKRSLWLYSKEEKYLRHLIERDRDKELLLKALKKEGLLAETCSLEELSTAPMNKELCLSIYDYLSRTPCMLVSVSLDDMLGVLDQQNLPGVIDIYPCWRQKSPLSLDEIISDTRVKNLSEMFSRNSRQ